MNLDGIRTQNIKTDGMPVSIWRGTLSLVPARHHKALLLLKLIEGSGLGQSFRDESNTASFVLAL